MKSIVAVILLAMSFTACRTLHSTTYIEPNKAFVLGDDNHGPLSVKVQNIGKDIIQVTLTTRKGEKVDLGMLNVNETKTYSLPPDCSVSFQNTSDSNTSTIKIKAKGDTNLSMGYQ